MPVGATTHARAVQPASERIVIERGGRRIALGLPRYGVPAIATVLALVFAWSIAAGVYVIFHDAVVAELRHGADVSAKGYQAQLAAMRDELERARTRRLVEKSGFDDSFDELVQRQAAIEKRQQRLDALTDSVSLSAADRADVTSSLKPVPVDEARPSLDGAEPVGGLRPSTPGATEKMKSSMNAIELNQARTLEHLARKTTDRRRTLERVYELARLRRPATDDGRARGGPFEPAPSGALTFDTRADEVEAERAVVAAFERGLARAPLRTPAPGAPISSGFGVRPDPFLGRAAFHAGIDFERGAGEDVRATAAGRVVSAGWSGGYGEMVEVDHGGGLSTRYGHLSSILVKTGDEVRIGSLVGRVGSTGRSTGPHLHYETRVNGDAVDPMRFLNAGRLLAAR